MLGYINYVVTMRILIMTTIASRAYIIRIEQTAS